MAKKNSKKNKFKAKDRFRNSIITNESIATDSSQEVSTSTKVTSTTVSSVSSVRINSLGTELKLIGLIGFFKKSQRFLKCIVPIVVFISTPKNPPQI